MSTLTKIFRPPSSFSNDYVRYLAVCFLTFAVHDRFRFYCCSPLFTWHSLLMISMPALLLVITFEVKGGAFKLVWPTIFAADDGAVFGTMISMMVESLWRLDAFRSLHKELL